MNIFGTPPNRDSVDLKVSVPGPCPPESVWRELMTDTQEDAADSHSAALLTHASHCAHCSRLLAQAIQNSPGISTPEEAAWLESLPSSTPKGQRRLAETMQRVAAGEVRPQPRALDSSRRSWNWFSWQTVALGGVSLVLLCGALWFTLREPSDKQLLAAAYDQHRLTELRLGQGHAVPLESPTRGASTDVSSTELLKIKLRTQQRLQATPDDATVRQTLGRIALVEHDGAAAVRDFEMAQALSPDLPGLNLDLASAYFEIAESSGQSLDYARAIDYFGKHLKAVGGKDSAALFNRGLAWERQSVYTEAIKDYEAALAQEKDQGWRAEIERHLKQVRSRSAEYGHPEVPNSKLTPASLLALTTESPGDYELYLIVASRDWLSHRAQDPQIAAALQKLAQWGLGHKDNWLADLLRVAPTPRELEAETTLSRSLAASSVGAADPAMEAATAASSMFKALGNKAGLARADSEIVYSLHRQTRSVECLARAHDLQRSHALDRYSSQAVYVELEISSCLAMQKDQFQSLAFAEKAALDARATGLAISRLRAMGFAVEMNNDLDAPAIAWRIGVAGLEEAEKIQPAVMRRYQLFYGLKEVATKLGLAWTTVGLSDAANTVASRSENVQTRAYAEEQLGVDQARVGEEAAALNTYRAADEVLKSLPDGITKTNYLIDWAVDRAPLRARRPEALPAVLNEFRHSEQTYQTIDGYRIRLDFYLAYINLLLRSNRVDEALEKSWYSVQQAEISLGKAPTDAAREGAAEIGGAAYLDVVRSYLLKRKPDDALRTWMWFQAALARPAAGANVQPQQLAAQLPPLPVLAPDRLTLVFARVDDHYVAWALRSGVIVQTQTLPRPAAQIDFRAAVLQRLCADPRSSASDLAVVGEGLYRDLIAPFDTLVQQAAILQFQLDPALASLPVAALQHNGRYLGLEKPLLFYAGGWSVAAPGLRQSITEQERIPSDIHLLVLQQKPPAGQAVIPGDYDESAEVARAFRDADQRQASVWRQGTALFLTGDPGLSAALPAAGLLHYTGHGLSRSAAVSPSSGSSFALQNHSLPHCRLAVLAACESLHERESIGNDVPSFARILLRAGASHVLATQWDVDSRSTRELMVRFYAELAEHQTSPQALLRAQQSLYRQAGSAHPYFWSPFQIVSQ